MVCNALYAVTTIPGILLLLYALLSRQVALAAVGVLAMAAWPFTSFGLYHAAGQAVAREPIHLSTFLAGGRRRLGLAYRWGALNLAVVGVLSVNAFFYLDPQAPLYGSWLGSFLGAFFLLGCLVWVGGQACLLGLLEILEAASLRAAWRERRLAIGVAPGVVLGTALLSVALFVAGIVVLPLGMLLAFACAAVLTCRMASDLRRAHSPLRPPERFSDEGARIPIGRHRSSPLPCLRSRTGSTGP
jgi:hypothetical protein